MRRTVATVWHASFSVIAAILYFFFVLPRWWELTGATSPVLGTVLRIVAAVLIALAALPVTFTWMRTRKPENRTPQRALRLLIWSIVAHVLAGVLIAGTAISEIWLSLDRTGQWLFGIYGAAAAIALLGIGGFYLSFIAELPPPPPKPAKPKKPRKPKKQSRRRKDDSVDEGPEEGPEEASEEEAAATETTQVIETDGETSAEPTEQELVSSGKRRPAGKRRTKNSD